MCILHAFRILISIVACLPGRHRSNRPFPEEPISKQPQQASRVYQKPSFSNKFSSQIVGYYGSKFIFSATQIKTSTPVEF
uniref:Putative secreted protein n=1 Tax=Anopheles triannulatus TaxID=58253 RepID=A0A2M4B4L8_9DIPT